MNSFVSPAISRDTQAILLLCGRFTRNGEEAVAPLTQSEYNEFAHWLRLNDLRPAVFLERFASDSIDLSPAPLPTERLTALLQRGAAMAIAVEQWTNNGLWVVSRADPEYPTRLRERLKEQAPVVLYGAGPLASLGSGGLAMVGSRNVDENGRQFARWVAEACAASHITVISGGARGVDQESMNAALEAGGKVVGVLADSLARSAVSQGARRWIEEESLVLVSPYYPHAGFQVGLAMGRNKIIYALADAALVVSAEFQKGGTWSGAVEALRKLPGTVVYVRAGAGVPEGNEKLLRHGGTPFPENWRENLTELVRRSAERPSSPSLFDHTPGAAENF